jgi:hypothetical protein
MSLEETLSDPTITREVIDALIEDPQLLRETLSYLAEDPARIPSLPPALQLFFASVLAGA